MSKQRVLLTGATGHTGASILDGLLDYGKFEVEALARPSSAQKSEWKVLEKRGVKVVVADIANDSIDQLVAILKGFDVVISTIDTSQLGQAKLDIAADNFATAAKKAGVKRFVPCAWGPIAPVGGVMYLRDAKEKSYNHIKQIRLPYTIIDVGWWHQAVFPKVPSGRFDYAAILPLDTVHGDGETPTLLGDLRDIGPWTARIIDDERTLNKSVVTWSDSIGDNQIIAQTEEVTGEKLPPFKKISFEEIEAKTFEARAKVQQEPDNAIFKSGLFMQEYRYSRYVRGDNEAGYAKYLGFLDARELYPDFKPITFRQFLKDILEQKIKKPEYDMTGKIEK